jgi:putative NIF3 family GTP cyclohydrolase 1 type 2
VSHAQAAARGRERCAPLLPVADGAAIGLGRVGQLTQPRTLREFAEVVRDALPVTAPGVRVAGDPASTVQRVAVWGGSGADALDPAARAGVDVLVTSDLKHHAALDAREAGGPALVDVPHAASEWPWVPHVAALLRADLASAGHDAAVHVSSLVTDPWDFRA